VALLEEWPCEWEVPRSGSEAELFEEAIGESGEHAISLLCGE